MADVFSKTKRSQVMSRIRSRGNKETELALAKLLRRHGIKGWRRHVQVRIAEFGVRNDCKSRSVVPTLRISHSELRTFGVRPDFIFHKSRTAIFVDGCFWHGCSKHATKPKNNRAFWHRKLSANKTRDRLVNHALRRANWRVIRIWECALQKRPQSCVSRILRALR
jgi:DNA mismatch endonuclease (patch repair protein)